MCHVLHDRTSGRRTGYSQTFLDLRHELVLTQSEPDDRNAKHQSLGQRHRVLTKCIVHRSQRPAVVTTIDLNDQSAFKFRIQIDPLAQMHDALAHGLRQFATTTHASEVELAEGVRSIADIPDHAVEESSPRRARYLLPVIEQALGRRQPLLDRKQMSRAAWRSETAH